VFGDGGEVDVFGVGVEEGDGGDVDAWFEGAGGHCDGGEVGDDVV
jgi:hypothetical protein